MKRYILLVIAVIFTLTEACSKEQNDENSSINKMIETNQTANKMNLKIGNRTLTATLAENSSAEALIDLLKKGPLTIQMSDYGNMEKVGGLGQSLPRNDQQITAQPGDIILYQGNALVIYYAPNSWNFTRLAQIDDVTAQELKGILGKGDVTVTLSYPEE